MPNERFAYAWKGGHEANVGYGSRLDTVVTLILSKVENGTRLRLVHSGFVLPKNDAAFKNMSEGWKKVVRNIGAIVDGQDSVERLTRSEDRRWLRASRLNGRIAGERHE